MNYRIYFDIPVYAIILLAVVSAGLSYLMYRKIEGLTRSRQYFLGGLRALSYFLLLLAAANLVTDFVRIRTEKRTAIILIDDSRSMSLTDAGTPRPRIVHDVLESTVFGKLASAFNVSTLPFGGNVLNGVQLDSLKFDQPVTNIESAITDASKIGSGGGAAFALLISDGNYNTGGSPIEAAKSLGIPVFTIGIGDSVPPKDIIVRQVITAPSMYAGKKSSVGAVISSTGFVGRPVTALLMDDGKQIDSKLLTLPAEGDVEVSFKYTPASEGLHVLTVYVPPQKGEFNRRNNASSVTADVLKGKYSVLLVAGEPASDVAFLRRNVEAGGDFDISVLVQKDGDNFYAQDPPQPGEVQRILSEKYDAVMLYDFPNSQSRGTLSRVSEILRASAVPYVYFAGKNFSAGEVSRLPRIPIIARNLQPGEFQVGISTAASTAVGLQPLEELLSANSSLFPPLYYQRIDCLPVPGAAVIAEPVLNGARIETPMFVVDQAARSAAFLAYGIWRLQLMSSLSGLPESFLHDFLTDVLRTLMTSGRDKLLTVHTNKRVYDPSERVNFNALFVDQTGSPVNDASVEVKVRGAAGGGSVGDVGLSGEGGGAYGGGLSGLGEGRYAFVARAKSPSGLVGADSGTIVVEPLNTEFVHTETNVKLLRQIASVTGGEFLTPQAFIDGGLHIQPDWTKPISLTDTRRFELLSLLPVLAVVILLLSVEWISRKLWGLP